jgi:thiol:disulfide interchange protein DsbD
MTELLYILPLALLGGLVLNVMPCVLPVLTMKVFHLMQQSAEDMRVRRLHAVAYAGGVTTVFGGIGVVVLLLRTSMQMMWGSQFQSPLFMLLVVALLLVFGLQAMGVFEWTVSARQHTGRGGLAESWVHGVVASIMATPCTGPGLAPAAGYAFASETPWWATLLVFLVLGVGFAAPFVLVTVIPALGRLLPRPGEWMNTFKKLMGLTLVGAAVFFFTFLQHQLSTRAAGGALVFLFMLGASLWCWGNFGQSARTIRRQWIWRVVCVLMVVLAGQTQLSMERPQRRTPTLLDGPVVVDDRIAWRAFDESLIERTRESGRPVFVDFTAEWCVNCKANERLFIEVPAIRQVLMETQILPVQADLTDEDPLILRWLSALGRSGIPVYAIYLPGGEVDLLPSAITTELLASRLRAASRRFPPVDG